MSGSSFFTTTMQGGEGDPFDDTPPDPQGSYITKIVLHFDEEIEGIQVIYSGKNARVVTRGLQEFGHAEISLGAGEYVTRIEGRADEDAVNELTFITNEQTYGPFGGSSGECFVWEGPVVSTKFSPARPMRLLAFSGRVLSGDLFALQAIFWEPGVDAMKTIRYERQVTQATPSPRPFEFLSSFTRHLMNIIITLFVGKERVQFSVHKDTLCQLPFFQAALSGGFKEAAEQVIALPEDNPNHVSALIEFLYTGNYTYPYPDTVDLPDGCTVPAGDTAECMFHIGIYVVASKYDCQGLVQLAAWHFEYTESELDGIDVLRVWEAAYEVDIRFSARTVGKRSGDGLAGWVKKMFREHREEMEEAFAESPMLAADLLDMVTGSDDYMVTGSDD